MGGIQGELQAARAGRRVPVGPGQFSRPAWPVTRLCPLGNQESTHELVGTDFVPGATKKGNELIEPSLARLLHPQVDFRFHEVELDGSRVVLLEVARTTSRPMAFKGAQFIRVGSSTRKLRDHPAKERQLWQLLLEHSFEDGIAAEHLAGRDVLQALGPSGLFPPARSPPGWMDTTPCWKLLPTTGSSSRARPAATTSPIWAPFTLPVDWRNSPV